MRARELAPLVGLDDLTDQQFAVVEAALGEPLEGAGLDFIRETSGRPDLDWTVPRERPQIVCLAKGRQSGGTSRCAPLYALHRALDPATVEGLAVGERVFIPCLAPNQQQAGLIFSRLAGLVMDSPLLRRKLSREPTAQEIQFEHGVSIVVRAASSITLRGMKCAAVCMDESAFFFGEGSRSDGQILDALLPALAHVAGSQVLMVSSPWTEEGRFYELYRERVLRDDVLFIQAASDQLFPAFPREVLERERERDPDYFSREYLAQFVASFEKFIPGDSLERCIERGIESRPPERAMAARYVAAVDLGFRRDGCVLGIAHAEPDGRIVVDRWQTWAPRPGRPVKAETMVPELVQVLRDYRITRLASDQYSSDLFREVLRTHNVGHDEVTFSATSKPQLYARLREAIVAEQITLLDHRASLRELRTLETRRSPSGQVRIEAPQRAGYFDDHADVLAILCGGLKDGAQQAAGSWGDEESAWVSPQDEFWKGLEAQKRQELETRELPAPNVYQT